VFSLQTKHLHMRFLQSAVAHLNAAPLTERACDRPNWSRLSVVLLRPSTSLDYYYVPTFQCVVSFNPRDINVKIC